MYKLDLDCCIQVFLLKGEGPSVNLDMSRDITGGTMYSSHRVRSCIFLLPLVRLPCCGSTQPVCCAVL